MAINDILNKITDEAIKKAAFAKQIAEDEVKKIESEARAKAKEREQEIEKSAKERCESVISQARILANMESRSMLLGAKREVIDEAYKSALDELNTLDDNAYTDLLVSMFKKVSGSMSEGELIIPADKKHQTKTAMQKADVKYEITKETNDFKGGFILMNKKIEVNFSFPYIMANIIRLSSELETAEILF